MKRNNICQNCGRKAIGVNNNDYTHYCCKFCGAIWSIQNNEGQHI